MFEETAKDMLEFIDASPTAYNAVDNLEKMLVNAGYTLVSSYASKLEDGKGYYIKKNGSSICAFIYRNNFDSINMASAHSDSPCLRLKPNACMNKDNQAVRLNCEEYGGMLRYTWFDRPLSIAGRVCYVSDEGKVVTKTVDLKKDLVMLPSLAIHMNRKVNEGFSPNVQTEMTPILSQDMTQDEFDEMICENAGIEKTDNVSYELFLYPTMKGTIWGTKGEFVSSSRLDDLMCAYSLTRGLIESKAIDGVLPLVCIFDNEEIGSNTKQGADSPFLNQVLHMITENASKNFADVVEASLMVSADNAHAIHPNYPQVCDVTNKCHLNEGIVIKRAGNQKYSTDALSEARLVKVLNDNKIPYQFFANRSDIPGGSTLGNISTSHVNVATVDIGLAMYAMHSSYETAGVKDTLYLVELMKAYL